MIALRLKAFVAAMLLLVGAAQAADKITVGSKIDTEGALLGHLIVLTLQNAGLTVESRIQLGPTKIVRTALTSGEIDIYPEYTGNAGFFFNMESDPAWKNADAAYAKARDLDRANKLVWLQRAPANNTWGIAVRADVAKQNKLATLEDFGKWVAGGGKVKLACSAEFAESAGALPAFQKAYGFTLGSDKLLVLSGGDTAATIRAAAEQTSGVNAAMAYGTDGALAAVGLTWLTDTKGVQAVYEPAPVVRAAVLERNPQIKTALEPVFASLNIETLRALNSKIAVEGQDPRRVAADYLKSKGLVK